MTKGQRTIASLLAIVAALLAVNLAVNLPGQEAQAQPRIGPHPTPDAPLSVAAACAADPPIGSVTAWLKSFTGVPALPGGWVECNGQVLVDPESLLDGEVIPDLNGVVLGTQRFLRGSTASGATGGTEDHSHLQTNPGNFPADNNQDGQFMLPARNVAQTGPTSTLPSHYEVVWIMKVKTTAPCPTDTNDDGVTNVLDLIQLLLQFGQACP